jgi:hypothetical protein
LLISTVWLSLNFRQKTNDISNLCASYNKILGLFHELEPQDNFLNQIRIPKLSDKQLIALALAAESSSIDSERHLFKQLPATVAGQIDRSVFNRRRRQLAFKIEHFRQRMVSALAPSENYYFVDSMPLEICKFGRAKRLRTCALWVFVRRPTAQNLITAIARCIRRIISAIRSMRCVRPTERPRLSIFPAHRRTTSIA